MAHDHRQRLAQLIYSMPYGELITVGHNLSDMIDKEVRPKIKTPREFADALYDWAEAEVYESSGKQND